MENFDFRTPDKNINKNIIRKDGSVSIESEDFGKDYFVVKNIIFTDINNNQFDLKSLLPNGWNFIIFKKNEKNKFCSYPYEKDISFGSLENDGSLLVLLHEIGHAQNQETGKEIDEYGYREIILPYLKKNKTGEISKEKIEESKEIENYVEIMIYDPERKTKNNEAEDCYVPIWITKEAVRQYGATMATMERNASAFALKKINEIRKQGIQIEGSLASKDLVNEIYSVLQYIEKQFENNYYVRLPDFVKNKVFKEIDILKYF